MAIFKSFRAFRPAEENQELIPELPYDCMSSNEARELVKGNPLSFIHIDRAEVDFPKGTNQYSKEIYLKAKENLEALEKSGALIQDKQPCFYIYRQTMNGRVQTGLAGCACIDDYLHGVIKKHEKTLSKKEEDRINHVNITNADTGPIFITYRKNDDISRIINNFAENNTPVYNFNKAGACQTVWVIDDEQTTRRISALFEKVSAFYIADGHHRCVSAVKVGEMRRKENPEYTGKEEFNYFLAVAFPDRDLHIMDYNRVVRDLNSLSEKEFFNKISKVFEINKESKAFKPKEKHSFGMYLNKSWYSLFAKKEITESNNPVKNLDVSVLQDNLLDPILGIKDPKNDSRIDFVGGIRGLEELEKRACSDMKIAFSMFPPTIEELMEIADVGGIMPPKSTWFEPKLLSGLFIHPLD
ncbi:MAG: DUF1015 family protein [Clostridiales bacterium]|nr:DUF1015 family protein [Clostridiales bacterium]